MANLRDCPRLEDGLGLAARVVSDLAELLGRGKPVLMGFLEAYMDESRSQNPERVLTVAGYIGEREDWIALSGAWQAVLDAEEIKAFHATDAESLKGEFSGWTRDRQQALTRKLTELVRKVPVIGFASSLYLGTGQPRSPTAEAFADHSYVTALFDCVTELAHLGGAYIGMEQEIAFVMEDNEAWSYRLGQAFLEMKRVPEFVERKRLSETLTLGSRPKFKPLQVADFLAFESMKSVENILTRPELEPRKSLRLLALNQRTFVSMRSVFDLERAMPVKVSQWIDANYRSKKTRKEKKAMRASGRASLR